MLERAPSEVLTHRPAPSQASHPVPGGVQASGQRSLTCPSSSLSGPLNGPIAPLTTSQLRCEWQIPHLQDLPLSVPAISVLTETRLSPRTLLPWEPSPTVISKLFLSLSLFFKKTTIYFKVCHAVASLMALQ